MSSNIASTGEVSGASALDSERCYRLSRYLQLQPSGQGFIVNSLITGRHELLPNSAAGRLLLSLSVPRKLAALLAPLDAARSTLVREVLGRWFESRLITEVADDGSAGGDAIDSLRHWEAHHLAFHLSR